MPSFINPQVTPAANLFKPEGEDAVSDPVHPLARVKAVLIQLMQDDEATIAQSGLDDADQHCPSHVLLLASAGVGASADQPFFAFSLNSYLAARRSWLKMRPPAQDTVRSLVED